MTATEDLWEKTTPVEDLSNTVNVLWEAIYIILHPQILSIGRVQEMFRKLLNIYTQNNGEEEPDHMYYVLIIRVQSRQMKSAP